MFLTLAQAQSPALLVEQAQLALLGGERPHHPDALGVLGDGVGDVGEPSLDQPRDREQPAAQLDADPQHERHRRQRDQRERKLMVAIITKATTAAALQDDARREGGQVHLHEARMSEFARMM